MDNGLNSEILMSTYTCENGCCLRLEFAALGGVGALISLTPENARILKTKIEMYLRSQTDGRERPNN